MKNHLYLSLWVKQRLCRSTKVKSFWQFQVLVWIAHLVFSSSILFWPPEHNHSYVTEACLANLPEVDLLPWICPTTEIIWLRRPIVELRLGRRPSIGWRIRRPILKMFLIFSETIAEARLPWYPAVELRLGHCYIEQRLGHYPIEPGLREYSIVLRLGHYPSVPPRLRRPTVETFVPLQELCQLRHLPRLLHELLLEA